VTTPLVVADRRRVPQAEVDRWIEDGWRVDEGLDLPSEPWDLADRRWMRSGCVADDEELAAAALAAVRGVGLVVGCTDADLRARLVEDLARVGQVTELSLGADPLDVLDEDQRAVLQALAGGATITEAAAAVHLSPRTTERRVSAARQALGVRTTAQAVALVVGDGS